MIRKDHPNQNRKGGTRRRRRRRKDQGQGLVQALVHTPVPAPVQAPAPNRKQEIGKGASIARNRNINRNLKQQKPTEKNSLHPKKKKNLALRIKNRKGDMMTTMMKVTSMIAPPGQMSHQSRQSNSCKLMLSSRLLSVEAAFLI